MKANIERARTQLGELGALAQKTEAAERKILAAAEKRLGVVQAEIEKARPGVEAAEGTAQDRYLELVAERGKLQMVIARAKKALGAGIDR